MSGLGVVKDHSSHVFEDCPSYYTVNWRYTSIFICQDQHRHAVLHDMSQQESDHYSIVPAHLDYLSIYCPELGTSEQNETDQLLFHYAHPVKSRRRKEQSIHEQEREDAEAAHKSMRQIGLAQGMVNFAR